MADGRIRYRGMEVTKLALWRPFEEVAAWLWTGGLVQAAQPWQATRTVYTGPVPQTPEAPERGTAPVPAASRE